ncbi:unnamed protein product [Linum tenue]|uniref:Uncharacterized protein n=1 Tax=Linum tenue TaxID=586396 RepID=A0AAV0JLV5_9ROSI|nr:unnamed protein product [Linum tenue]
MRPRSNGVSRSQREQRFEGGGPNWILIAGGALLSTLTIRLGSKLKQTLDSRRETNARNEKLSDRRRSSACHMHPNVYSFTHDDDSYFNSASGNEGTTDVKYPPNDHTLSETDGALPLVTVNAPEYSRENGIMWVSSLERLELPPKPFHHSNCSDSPCVSESGSDIFSKREVIQKLRQQLKRRDDMIIEMQDQIVELQNSVNAQLGISNNLQSQLDVANKDLLDSEREIQRLRKAIADHCLKHANGDGKPSVVTVWPPEVRNGHANGYSDGESTFEFPEKGRMDVEKVEMLRREVGELKEVLEGKEYLLQNYKEQKSELSMKIKELQQRLDSQLPNIL